MTWIRVLAAAGLSVFFPGAGHALIRDWARALLFAGLFVLTAVFFFPLEAMSTAESFSEATTIFEAETSRLNQFMLSFIVIFAAVDSALRALGYPPGASADGESDGPSCPHCGKELDDDLAFCHWCTTRIEPETEEEEPAD
ncbi:DUF7575 domain-containing protein [Natrialbaceae archaeon A-gly3]